MFARCFRTALASDFGRPLFTARLAEQTIKTERYSHQESKRQVWDSMLSTSNCRTWLRWKKRTPIVWLDEPLDLRRLLEPSTDNEQILFARKFKAGANVKEFIQRVSAPQRSSGLFKPAVMRLPKGFRLPVLGGAGRP